MEDGLLTSSDAHDRDDEQKQRRPIPAVPGEDAAAAGNLGTAIHALFMPFGGVELPIPPREPMPEPPTFD